MAQRSLFRTLLDSPWWMSLLAAVPTYAVGALLSRLFPGEANPHVLGVAAALPFLGMAVYTGWLRIRRGPSVDAPKLLKALRNASPDDMRAMLPTDLIRAHRQRALSPDRPVIRGTAQNPDVYFQARETVNKYYLAMPEIVQNAMDRFAEVVGRQYKLFEYNGAPDAERVVIMMGSGAFVATFAGVRFIGAGRLHRRAALGLALGGIPGVIVAAWLVRSLPLDALRWLVLAVVSYAAVTLLRAGLRNGITERQRSSATT